MKRMWEIKQRAENPNVLELYIYGDVEADYFDWWKWENVESETSADFFRQELTSHPDVSEIHIYINSYGGSVFEGTAIYAQLKRHPAKKVVHVDGFACSVASVIAMAGDEVIMPRNALMMIHNMWRSAVGNASQLRKAADDLEVINAAGRQAYLQKSGGKLDEAKLAEMMDAETWLTAQQCIDFGLADKLAEEDADMTKANEILQKANLGMEQRISAQKGLAAQLRQLLEPEKREPPAENPILKMFI